MKEHPWQREKYPEFVRVDEGVLASRKNPGYRAFAKQVNQYLHGRRSISPHEFVRCVCKAVISLENSTESPHVFLQGRDPMRAIGPLGNQTMMLLKMLRPLNGFNESTIERAVQYFRTGGRRMAPSPSAR